MALSLGFSVFLIIFLFALPQGAKDSRHSGRSDPNYTEEFRQVIDASLKSAIAVVGENAGNDSSLSFVLQAFRELKAVTTVQSYCSLCIITRANNSNASTTSSQQISLRCKNSPKDFPENIDIFVLLYPRTSKQQHMTQYPQCGDDEDTRSFPIFMGGKLNLQVHLPSVASMKGNIVSPTISGYQVTDASRQPGCGRVFDAVLVPSVDDANNYRSAWITQYGYSHSHAWSALHPPEATVFTTPLLPAAVGGNVKEYRKAVEDMKRVVIDGVIASTFKNFVREHMTSVRSLSVASAPLPSLPALSSTSNAIAKSSTTTSSKNAGVIAVGASDVKSRGGAKGSTGGAAAYAAAAVIIEPRIDFAFEFCVRNVMHHLGASWGLVVYHSTGENGNEAFVRSSLKDLPNTRFVQLPVEVNSGDSYNSLLKSAEFWGILKERLGLKKVLMFQSDSVMLRRGIEEFLQYDYIGAPWHMVAGASSGVWLRRLQRRGGLVEGVGNGGFSLRSVGKMLEIAAKYGGKNNGANEDTFFVMHAERMPHFLLPKRSTAYRFAVEMPCSDLVNMTISAAAAVAMKTKTKPGRVKTAYQGIEYFTPLALHTSWAYLSPEIIVQLLELAVTNKESIVYS